MHDDGEREEVRAPEGYTFAVASGGRAHLVVEDETAGVPICGAGGGEGRQFDDLPHAFEPCPACLRIAGEASTRP